MKSRLPIFAIFGTFTGLMLFSQMELNLAYAVPFGLGVALDVGTHPIGSAQFVWIRPGNFMMGSPEYEEGRFANETLHPVTISRGFEMQTTEVTQSQWYEVMGTNPSSFNSRLICPGSFLERNGTSLCPNHPVERVSYEDVRDFLQRLNRIDMSGYTYRLPTEEEWEYSARAGTTTAYSFGGNVNDLGDYGVFYMNSGNHTAAVGTKRPNAWGLYDMHGNVWEWTDSLYERGGNWHFTAPGLRSASRGYAYAPARINPNPSAPNWGLGIRLVRTAR